jgi:hypothetical protein
VPAVAFHLIVGQGFQTVNQRGHEDSSTLLNLIV